MRYLLLITLLSSTLFAQFDVAFGDDVNPAAKVILTPYLRSEIMMTQGLYPHAGIGAFELRDIETGFDLTILDNLTASFVVELDGDDGYHLGLNTVSLSYGLNEFVIFSGGVLTNGFGMLEFNALSYPLIYDDLETIQPAIMVDAGNDVIYGSLAMYQGMQTDNFLAFAPVLGITIGEIADIKVSSRIEIEDGGSYSDIAIGFKVAPLDFLEIRSEFISELNQKKIEIDDTTSANQQVLGYFAEAAFFAGERWTIAARYDERIEDQAVAKKTGVRAVEGSATFAVLEPLTVSLGVTAYNEFAPGVIDWSPELKLLATFELPW